MKKNKKQKIKNLKVSPSVKEKKKLSLKNSGSYCIIGVSLFQILVFSIVPKIFYQPDNRELDTSNLFSENQVIISSDQQTRILEELEKKLGIKIEDNEENYLLLNAVSANPYLTAKEKEIFYKFIEYFNDNPYINREEIYTNMLNVNARFAVRRNLQAEDNVLALYLPVYRDIIYFELFPSVDTMAHEDGHCINETHNIPTCISEGMDEIISLEYFSETPFVLTDIYPYEISFVKLLCEMIGTDTVLQAYTEDNPEYIYDALDKLIESKGKAKPVIESVNWYMTTYRHNKTFTKEEEERASEALLDFLEFVNSCEYKDKDAFQYHLSVFVNVFTDYYGKLEDYQKIVLCKAYISSRLKSEGYSNSIIMAKSDYLGNSYQK